MSTSSRMNNSASPSTTRTSMRIRHYGSRAAQLRLQSKSHSVANSVLAGYVAGVCGVTIGHPMDSLKVFLQTGTPVSASNNSATSKMMSSASSSSMPHGVTTGAATSASSHQAAHMSTIASRAAAAATAPQQPQQKRVMNLRTLYAGVGAPLITVGLIQSANFCMYDSLRRYLHKRDDPSSTNMDYMNQDRISNVAIASMTAGSILSVITSPLLVVKTKQQVMTWDFKTAFKDTMRKSATGSSRTSNFFVGFGPHFLSESVGRGIYFASYESIKRWMATTNSDDLSPSTVTLPQRMVAAGMSGILCWSVIFPLDVLRNRMCAKAITTLDTGSAWDMAKSMYREDKFRPFYRGFSVTVLRAGPVAAAVLPVYDATLEWLNEN